MELSDYTVSILGFPVSIIGKTCYIDWTIADQVGVGGVLHQPVRVRAGPLLTPHRGSGIGQSMSQGFAFIIPLKAQPHAAMLHSHDGTF